MKTLIKNARICNLGRTFEGYIVISGERIERVVELPIGIPVAVECDRTVDARGSLVIPGVVDDQVHFREPGLTDKGDIRSESRAAAAGGVTTYMEMPNTRPAATTIELLEQKFDRAAECSAVNYSFYLGATNDNIDQIESVDPERICGVKVFMGSSTGNMLVDSDDALANIFRNSPVLVATHCEQEEIVKSNMAAARQLFDTDHGGDIPPFVHPLIRSAEACYRSTAHAVELATRYGGRLHVLHLSTARELELFEASREIENKSITCEVCAHHLYFSDADYATRGNMIKWNPAIKTEADREALRAGVRSGRVDVVATDHAPHLLSEKQRPYMEAPSGGPLVQHSLAVMLTMAARGVFSVEQVVDRMCHAPARLFGLRERGVLCAGYFADIAIVETGLDWEVSREGLLYKCGWSPLEGERLTARVSHTFVNGEMVYSDGVVNESVRGHRVEFDR